MRYPSIVGLMLMLCCGAFAQQAPFRLYKSGELPVAMGRHGSCIVGQRLYTIGGEDNVGRRNQTYSAEIQSSGQLGQWRDEQKLPEKRAGLQNAVTVVGNRIYVVGGMGPRNKPGMGRLQPASSKAT